MKRIAVSLVAFCVFLAPLACSAVKGSGVAKTEQRQVAAFTEIELSGIGTMVVTQGSPASLTVTADDNVLPLVRTTVEGGRLRVETEGLVSDLKTELTFKVTVPELKRVDCSGATNLTLAGLSNDALQIDVSGAAKVQATGQTGTLTLDISGAADVKAAGLQAKVSKVTVSGAGSVEVFASEALDATISGTAKVRYAGEPKDVKQHVTGVGSIEKL